MSGETFLSPGQARALESLRPILKLATGGTRSSLPLNPRTTSLIIGPSGSGKSHLVRTLAHEAGLPFWETNMANWIVMGARNGNSTLASLIRWIQEIKSGVIFLDELDKLSGSGEWTNSIRLEVHDLIDARVPDGAIDVSGTTPYEELNDASDKTVRKSMIKVIVQEKLRNHFLIVGAGTCQGAWQGKRRQIGFQAEASSTGPIDRKQILNSIAPEILQRFREEILFLEPLTQADYMQVLIGVIKVLPPHQHVRFAELCLPAINVALGKGLGMRIFEEVYTTLCTEEILRESQQDEFPHFSS